MRRLLSTTWRFGVESGGGNGEFLDIRWFLHLQQNRQGRFGRNDMLNDKARIIHRLKSVDGSCAGQWTTPQSSDEVSIRLHCAA